MNLQINKEDWEKKYLNYQIQCNTVERINHNDLADRLLNEETIITLTDTKEILIYNPNTGLYEEGEPMISWFVQYVCTYKAKTHLVNETIESIKRRTLTDRKNIGGQTNLIPLQNKVYDFETNEYLDYSPDFYFTTKHPIVLTEEIEEENPIETFLNEITETQEDAVFLKEFVGYCFYRAMPFHTFVIIVGAGGNGKSVFLNILREMIGLENISERTLQELAEDRFASSDLYLKNVNVVGDLPRKALEDTGLLKRVSGNDIITAQKKYQSSFIFRPYAKIICAANEAPESPDMSQGFLRRTQIINFPHSFEGRENRNLAQELCKPEYISRFFLSCMSAFRDALHDNQWIVRESVAQKEQKYVNYSNSAIAFCTNKLEYDPDSELTTEQIWGEYQKYCEEHKLIKRAERHFFVSLYRHFQNRVYKKRKSVSGFDKPVREYVIIGICWK